jgi:subtilisin family serine protease
VGQAHDGRDVRVAVVDTGFLPGWQDRHSWLGGVTEFDADDPDRIPRDGFIDPFAGHGTFIAGIIGALAPAAEITVENVLQSGGVATESAVVRQIEQALERSPDIISLSSGGYTRGNVPSKAFAALWRHRLRDLGGLAIVSAAGNDTLRTPFWPTAFPWCVGVGALDAQGMRRSEFSNFGSWVDVYAPGEDFVNAYCDGYYLEIDPPHGVREFEGTATWSGTSFSAPLVASLVATRMSRTGENARLAAERLLEVARGNFLPGVGPRLMP